MFRRVASNRVFVDGHELRRYVVELDGDIVLRLYPLTKELPHTEWTSETLVVTTDSKGHMNLHR